MEIQVENMQGVDMAEVHTGPHMKLNDQYRTGKLKLLRVNAGTSGIKN